jgi:hypothetical protein
VARLIGVVDRGNGGSGRHDRDEVDSDAETELNIDEGMLLSLPSIIPETPLSAGSEAGDAANRLVAPSAQTDARRTELSVDAGQDRGQRFVIAVAVTSTADAMEDVVERTAAVNSANEFGSGGSCSQDCRALVSAVRVS